MNLFDRINGTIELQLVNGTTTGDPIVYELVVDNGSFLQKILVNKKFGGMQSIYINDCSSTTGFTGATWAITNEDFVSPSTSITDSPNGNYGDSQQKVILLTQVLTVPNIPGANLTFSAKWALEDNFDSVRFQVRLASANNWTSQCGKYTNFGNVNNGQFEGPLYDGEQNSWVVEQIDLDDYLGQNIRIRFILNSDDANNFDGFYFDDLQLNVPLITTLSTTQSEIQKFRIYPNPTHSLLTVNTKQTEYAIHIYNLLGQLVYFKESADGLQNIDVTDLKTGMYFIELSSSTFKETHKFYKN
jgi:hypothetical protein